MREILTVVVVFQVEEVVSRPRRLSRLWCVCVLVCTCSVLKMAKRKPREKKSCCLHLTIFKGLIRFRFL